MIAIDSNLLVYAHREDSPWHNAADKTVRTLAQGRSRWAIPWPCLHEFLAVVTHPRIYVPPTPVARALDQIGAWLEAPGVLLLAEIPGYWPVLKGLVERGRITGPLVHDARIAALCLQHGVAELWSADRDFTRFPELTVRNPLLSV